MDAYCKDHIIHQKKMKLDPRGEMGKPIGFDVDLKSYRIYTSDGRFVNSKNVVFLDFDANPIAHDSSDDIITVEKHVEPIPELKMDGENKVVDSKEDDTEDEVISSQNDKEFQSAEGDLKNENEDDIIAQSLLPSPAEPAGRILRDHTLQVKPVKYSHLAADPRSFKMAVNSENSGQWIFVIDDALGNIEQHQVWLPIKQFDVKIYNACLFMYKDKNSFIFFHVDDIIVIGRTEEFQQQFLTWFPNSSAHDPDTLLGMDLNIWEDSIGLSQPALIKKASDEEHMNFLKLNINYRTFTGILNYLACHSRPDLASAEMLHVWKYLKGTQDLGLLLKPKASGMVDHIQFYTDATWAEDQETRQKNIKLSFTESEMNALSDGEQENQWLTFLIEELFHVDNCGLLEKLKKFGSNSKTKHLDIKIKNRRDKFSKKEIDVKLIFSEDMIADSLSKAAPHSSVRKLQYKCLTVISPSNMEG
ncbi:hypothetical protein VP01_2117g1 [Puccinia sorghi]|uniref:Retroviral polymerase SH3-like domain-containing protein n=1 Tax=Puccinia sorghi TaxID=27349 RepID=A0A0L6VBU7_9BASI|nr:hypothetical protein VP01_2117g1 [Puccinia sorghi]